MNQSGFDWPEVCKRRVQCHANALRGGNLFSGVETMGGVPWWGFRWDTQGWWNHSFVTDGGLVIDSAPLINPPPIYFAMPYQEALAGGSMPTSGANRT